LNPAIEKLSKFLKLEAGRGYDNKAVLGGLQSMLQPWAQEAEHAGVPEGLRRAILTRLRDYPDLTPKSRAEALTGLWNRLYADYPDLKGAAVAAPAGAETVDEPEAKKAAADESETDVVGAAEPGANAETADEPEAEKAAADESETEATGAAEPGGEARADGETGIHRTDAGEEQAAAGDAGEEQAATGDAGDDTPASLEAPLTSVPGIGPKSARTLEKLGLQTLGDLLWHLPRRYDDYSKLKTINRLTDGEEITIIGTVDEIATRTVRGGKMKLVEATVGDGTGSIKITWFNQTWIANRLKAGRAVVLSGRTELYRGRLTMNSPEWEPLEREQVHTNRIVPVYPLTSGITEKWLRRVINAVVVSHAPRVPDPLPPAVLGQYGLMPYGAALQQVHFPDGWDQLKRAQERLAFNEMFLLQLGVLRQKQGWQELPSDPLQVDDGWMAKFTASLPYQLTEAQQQALQAVRRDLASPHPMNRLLQGDVGSGKTVIAAAAIGIAASNQVQSALMAPTSILAEQLFRSLHDLLPGAAGVPQDQIRLLLGSTPASEKAEIRQAMESGEVLAAVGTHALLEEPVSFSKLGLAIIDEQHRFGVNQRATLREKGMNPNLMVMTATPIPRSLSLTLYGDLDLSVIDELPPERHPIETQVLRPIERARAHNFIRGQLKQGRQAYIIYPLVEGSDKVQAKAAVDEYQRLQENAFPDFRLGLLHGRLKADEKDQVMTDFRDGRYDLLVSTAVVEVGVDVPNASVILVEGANRFGLSQLHQFRGRVGRGEHQSYCLLIPARADEAENERLKALEEISDGFELAEIDLQQRGPGDFLGTRQSGFSELKAARLTDVRLIEKARGAAASLFERDPGLEADENHRLASALDRFWANAAAGVNGKGEIS
jgi:ATP-dependent DNA helicase RecG